MKPWKDPDEKKRAQYRRQAAIEFLNQTTADTTLRGEITGLAKRAAAWKRFRELGDIDIPENVEVICFEAALESGRDDLVVFILPALGTLTPVDPMKPWMASWPPYDP